MPERTLRFQHKLWQVVNNCRTGAVYWSDSGDSVIFNFPQFKKEYLDRNVNFCKSNKIASFVRQLNLYGFRKLMKSNSSKTELHEFQNACFQRGRKDLLANVTRSSTISADLKRSLRSTEEYSAKKRGRLGRKCQKRKNSNYGSYEHRHEKQKWNKHYNSQITPVKFQIRLSGEYVKLSYQLNEYTRDPEDVENAVKEENSLESFKIGESKLENYSLKPTIKMTNFSANVLQEKEGHHKEMRCESTSSNKKCKERREYAENGLLFKKNEKNLVNLEQIACTTRNMLQNIPRFQDNNLFPPTSNNGAMSKAKHLRTVLVPQKTLVPINDINNASNIVTVCVPDKETNNQAAKQQEEILLLNSESTQTFTDEQQMCDKWVYLDDDFPCHDIADDADDLFRESNCETVEQKNYFDLDELPEVTMRNSSYSHTDSELTWEHMELRSARNRMKNRIKPSFCVCNSNIAPSEVFDIVK